MVGIGWYYSLGEATNWVGKYLSFIRRKSFREINRKLNGNKTFQFNIVISLL